MSGPDDKKLDELFGKKSGTSGKKIRYGALTVALLLSLLLNAVLFFMIQQSRKDKTPSASACPYVPASERAGAAPAPTPATTDDRWEKAVVIQAEKIAGLEKRLEKMQQKLSDLEYQQTRIADLEREVKILDMNLKKK